MTKIERVYAALAEPGLNNAPAIADKLGYERVSTYVLLHYLASKKLVRRTGERIPATGGGQPRMCWERIA